MSGQGGICPQHGPSLRTGTGLSFVGLLMVIEAE